MEYTWLIHLIIMSDFSELKNRFKVMYTTHTDLNDKIFFEPSISVRKEIGEVESINIVTTNSESPVITEVISPITDANHFRLNLSLSIRLGR